MLKKSESLNFVKCISIIILLLNGSIYSQISYSIGSDTCNYNMTTMGSIEDVNGKKHNYFKTVGTFFVSAKIPNECKTINIKGEDKDSTDLGYKVLKIITQVDTNNKKAISYLVEGSYGQIINLFALVTEGEVVVLGTTDGQHIYMQNGGIYSQKRLKKGSIIGNIKKK